MLHSYSTQKNKIKNKKIKLKRIEAEPKGYNAFRSTQSKNRK